MSIEKMKNIGLPTTKKSAENILASIKSRKQVKTNDTKSDTNNLYNKTPLINNYKNIINDCELRIFKSKEIVDFLESDTILLLDGITVKEANLWCFENDIVAYCDCIELNNIRYDVIEFKECGHAMAFKLNFE